MLPATHTSDNTPPFLDIIEANLFVDADTLLANIIAATKGPDGRLDWIELKPKLHGSLVKCALRLVSRHTATFRIASAKEALFTFLINLLNVTSRTPFLGKMKTMPASNCAKKPKERKKLKVDASEGVTKQVTGTMAETTHATATTTPEAIHTPLPDPLPAVAEVAFTAHLDQALPLPDLMPTAVNPEPRPTISETLASTNPSDSADEEILPHQGVCREGSIHDYCEECNRISTGKKHYIYPKCAKHRLNRHSHYVYGYQDYECKCTK